MTLSPWSKAKASKYVLYLPPSGALPVNSTQGRYEYFLFQWLKSQNIAVFIVEADEGDGGIHPRPFILIWSISDTRKKMTAHNLALALVVARWKCRYAAGTCGTTYRRTPAPRRTATTAPRPRRRTAGCASPSSGLRILDPCAGCRGLDRSIRCAISIQIYGSAPDPRGLRAL